MAKRPRTSARKRSRKKAGWAGDPLVPIAPVILRKAMRALGVSPAELSRRVGGHEQTLAHLMKDGGRKKGLRGIPLPEMKKTRASRRAAIANALGVAEELLAGELSYMPTGGISWYEYMYSAETWLAAQRLFTKVDTAVRRDIEGQHLGIGSVVSDADSIRSQVQDVVYALMRVGVWRSHLLRWVPARAAAQGYLEPMSENPADPFNSRPTVDDEHEAGSLALIRAVEHILAPWFNGTAALDYAALRMLATPTPPTHPSEREDPQAILGGAPVITFRREVQ
jgi:hypothetical protein